MLVWLNGHFVDRDQASISIFDAGFQHGVGLFETMLARHGAIFRPEAHLARLARSAKELLLSDRLRIDPMIDALHLTLKRNNLQNARVRLTLTGGNLNLLQSQGQSQVDPTIMIVAQPPTTYPDSFFEKGVTVTIADGRDNPLHPMAGHKTINYWPRIQALQLAAAKRAGESLWLTISNHLSAGSVSNIFLVKDGSLLTPIAHGEEDPNAVRSPVLPGITRAAIIELAENLDIQTRRQLLDAQALLDADEVFLTNSSWGVLPVTAIERKQIGDGQVGDVTKQLRRAWSDLVDQETQSADL
ncbi:MAG: aminotransferase class IV [Phycisphaerales bacterium]|nr:aminotransferase class IV [Phycisphaerales bacterium]MCI0676320.1 aminotransferase class IV [Phycisphaerales bacterium]